MLTTLLSLALENQAVPPAVVRGPLGTVRLEIRGGENPSGRIDFGRGLVATWHLPDTARIRRTVARPDRWEVTGTWEGGAWQMTIAPGRVARSLAFRHRVTYAGLGVSKGWQEGWRIAGAPAATQPTFSSDPRFWTAGMSGHGDVHGWIRPNLEGWDAASARTMGVAGLGVVQLAGSRREREARWGYDLALTPRRADWSFVAQGWEDDAFRRTQTQPGPQRVPFEQVANKVYTWDFGVHHTPRPTWPEGTTVASGWWQRDSDLGPIGGPNQPELEFSVERNAAQAAYGMWVWAEALRRFTWQQNAERVLRLALTAEGRLGGIFSAQGWRQGDDADAAETRYWIARALRRGAFQGGTPAEQAKMMPALFRLVDQAIEARDLPTLDEVSQSRLPEELRMRAQEGMSMGGETASDRGSSDSMALIRLARNAHYDLRRGGTLYDPSIMRLMEYQFTTESPYRVTLPATGAFFARSTPTLQGRVLALLHDHLHQTGHVTAASRYVMALRWQSATLRTNIDQPDADRPGLPDLRLTALASHGPMDTANLSVRWEDAAASAGGLADSYLDFGAAVVLRYETVTLGQKAVAPVMPAKIRDVRPGDIYVGIDGVGFGSPSAWPGVSLLARTYPSYGRSYVTWIRNGGPAREFTPRMPYRITRLSARSSGRELTVFGYLAGAFTPTRPVMALTVTPDTGAPLTQNGREGAVGPEIKVPMNPRWTTVRLSSPLGPSRVIDLRPGLPMDRAGAWIGAGQLLEAVQLVAGQVVVTTGPANLARMQGAVYSRPFLTGAGRLAFRYSLHPDPRVRLAPAQLDTLSLRVQDADSGEVWASITRADLTKGQMTLTVPPGRLGVVVIEDRSPAAGLTLNGWGGATAASQTMARPR